MGLKFRDEAINQELPENRHLDKEARLTDTQRSICRAGYLTRPPVHFLASKLQDHPPPVLYISAPLSLVNSCTTVTPVYDLVHPAPTFAQFLDRERSPIRPALHDNVITYEPVYLEGKIHNFQRHIAAPYMTRSSSFVPSIIRLTLHQHSARIPHNQQEIL